MTLRNKITLIGRTGKEVEIVNFENGMLAKVSLATTEHFPSWCERLVRTHKQK